jgi:hypothetical protein
MLVLLRPFSPSHPARLFPPTRPTDCFAIDYPGRALCPTTSTDYINGPFKPARTLSGGGAGLISYCALERAPTF